MRRNVAAALGVAVDRVSIKTNEGIGEIGLGRSDRRSCDRAGTISIGPAVGDVTRASRRLLAIVVGVSVIGACTRREREESPFSGTWILKYQGRNLLSLTISVDQQRISGSF